MRVFAPQHVHVHAMASCAPPALPQQTSYLPKENQRAVPTSGSLEQEQLGGWPSNEPSAGLRLVSASAGGVAGSATGGEAKSRFSCLTSWLRCWER